MDSISPPPTATAPSRAPGSPPSASPAETACLACGAALRPRWPALQVWRCQSCRLLVRVPMPTAADLDALYAASWSAPGQHVGETGGTDAALARAYAHCLAADLGRSDLGGLRILDFGAGDGAMAAALAALGARVTAVEPYGQPGSFGGLIDVFARLEDVPQSERFDGIVCLQVIEHLREPRPVLEALRQRLRDGGWLLLTTPNAASLRARLTGQRWTEVRKPGHVVLFCERSLRALLESLGGWRDIRRPAWRVQYSRQPLAGGLQVLLQRTGLGGDLRCLAFNISDPDASHG